MDIRKMIATIEIYIFVRTNKEISVRPIFPIEMSNFILAYNISKRWIENNNVTIKQVQS